VYSVLHDKVLYKLKLLYFTSLTGLQGRIPHFTKDQFWVSSKSDKTSVRLLEGVALSAFDFG